ncbi:hypothetical protein LSH36_329g03045 [Paralvinella palmiformis]|uniref:Endonuclease/exonuclease/phosphatase domain-containing protein n=1 Tax=Paralvinella palmiformis TaxID=53620 RepID=A0AAD9JFZ0_9ANNE|nr:hypothetical protein LSH36_329g03045 [Paralvinella palmiformis]
MIGTDQHLEAERHPKTHDLLDNFISSRFLPTVTLPTRITHNTSTLIDNSYIKCKRYDELVSGCFISVDTSDHFPLFPFIGQINHTKSVPKNVTYRQVDDMKLINIQNYLNTMRYPGTNPRGGAASDPVLLVRRP